MRPLRLEIEGFTSFKSHQTVNFEDLGLFVITGATGAGKSSILDAICFALYGQVPRAGSRVADIVSLGSPLMRVQLDFQSAGERFRVARRRRRKGSQEVTLERCNGGDLAAEVTSGGVSAANDRIEEIVGLDFGAFTRAVLLPQGEFDQFLKAKASERHEILTSLLDLGRYERAARSAGAEKSQSESKIQMAEKVIADEYEDATAENLKAIQKEIRDAEARLPVLDAAKATCELLVKTVTDSDARLEVIRRTTRRVEAAKQTLAEIQVATGGHEAKEAALAATHKGAVAELTAKEALLEAATGKLQKVEEATGGHEKLIELDRLVREWQSQATSQTELVGRMQAGATALTELDAQAATAAKVLATAAATEVDADKRAIQAEKDLEALREQSRAASLRATLQAGGSCPVCGQTVSSVPHGHSVQESAIGTAESASQQAAREAKERRKEKGKAQSTVDQQQARRAVLEEKRLEMEAAVAVQGARLSAAVRQLEGKMGRIPGEGSLAAINESLETLSAARRELDSATASHRSAAAQASAAAMALESGRQVLVASKEELTKLRLGLASAREGAIEHGNPEDFPDLGPEADRLGTQELLAWADVLVTGLEKHRDGLLEAVRQASDALTGLFTSVGLRFDDTEPQTAMSTIQELRSQVAASVESSTRRAERLEGRIDRRLAMEESKKVQTERLELYKMLSNELRVDRFPAFLLQETMTLLASLASRQLRSISGERYSLESTEKDFVVIDHANADEKRSVVTLSGGETFLASLSLALALSSSIVEVSGQTASSRLEAIFIDEGFGSLDPETLDVVVDALESLQEGDRMVGVITHVGALAERISSGLSVESTEAGSRVTTRA